MIGAKPAVFAIEGKGVFLSKLVFPKNFATRAQA